MAIINIFINLATENKTQLLVQTTNHPYSQSIIHKPNTYKMIPIHYILIFYLLVIVPAIIYNFKSEKKKSLFFKIAKAIFAVVGIIWNIYYRESPIMIDKIFLIVLIPLSLISAIGNIISKRSVNH